MSGNAATQPVTGNDSPMMRSRDYYLAVTNTTSLGSDGVNSTSEKAVFNALATTGLNSQQTSSSIPQAPPQPEDNNAPPSPRRGSKRSLISRSRQGSRSSRRSARHATKESRDAPPLPQNNAARSERKQKSGGFLSFLNCCRADEDVDTLKPEETEVPAKQRKIEVPSQRAAVPDESTDVVVSEKPKSTEPQFNEKTELTPMIIDEARPTISEKSREDSHPRTNRNELSHDRSTPGSTSLAAPVIIAPQELKQSEPSTSTQTATAPTSEPVSTDAVQTVNKPQLEFPPPPTEVKRENDVEMPDAAVVPPVQEQNLVEEPVQPHDVVPVPLPPPPPLATRINKTQGSSDVPPVPDPETESKQQWLLPPIQQKFKGRKCLILDLDETLVHSSFKILNQADFTIPVEIEGQYHNVYVIKRPGVDQFMKRVGELYEVVVFTASVSKYGDPLLDQLDIHHVVHHRLFRESCYNHQGNYVKVRISVHCEDNN